MLRPNFGLGQIICPYIWTSSLTRATYGQDSKKLRHNAIVTNVQFIWQHAQEQRSEDSFKNHFPLFEWLGYDSSEVLFCKVPSALHATWHTRFDPSDEPHTLPPTLSSTKMSVKAAAEASEASIKAEDTRRVHRTVFEKDCSTTNIKF